MFYLLPFCLLVDMKKRFSLVHLTPYWDILYSIHSTWINSLLPVVHQLSLPHETRYALVLVVSSWTTHPYIIISCILWISINLKVPKALFNMLNKLMCSYFPQFMFIYETIYTVYVPNVCVYIFFSTDIHNSFFLTVACYLSYLFTQSGLIVRNSLNNVIMKLN